MEDAHTHILEYKDTGAAFFAVFDGHGGNSYSFFKNICNSLRQEFLIIFF